MMSSGTRDELGLSLVEIMISLGIMSVALLAIGSVMSFGSFSLKQVGGKVETADLVRELRLILGNPNRCALIFSGISVPAASSPNLGVPIAISLEEGHLVTPESTSRAASLKAGMTFNQLNVNRLDLRVGAKLSLTQYEASVILEVASLGAFSSLSNPAGKRTERREIPLILNVHPKSNMITGCSSRSQVNDFSQSEGNQICLMVASAGNYYDPKIWDFQARSCADTVITKTVYGSETRALCESGWVPVSNSASSCTYTFANDSQPMNWTAVYDDGSKVTAGPPPVATYIVTSASGTNFCGCIPAVGVSGTRCGIICKQ